MDGGVELLVLGGVGPDGAGAEGTARDDSDELYGTSAGPTVDGLWDLRVAKGWKWGVLSPALEG